MSDFTASQVVSFRVLESGDVELVTHDDGDDCTLTNRIDVGRDGSGRRLFILETLARREGLRLVNTRGRTVVR